MWRKVVDRDRDDNRAEELLERNDADGRWVFICPYTISITRDLIHILLRITFVAFLWCAWLTNCISRTREMPDCHGARQLSPPSKNLDEFLTDGTTGWRKGNWESTCGVALMSKRYNRAPKVFAVFVFFFSSSSSIWHETAAPFTLL